jgi:hypothetical protein
MNKLLLSTLLISTLALLSGCDDEKKSDGRLAFEPSAESIWSLDNERNDNAFVSTIKRLSEGTYRQGGSIKYFSNTTEAAFFDSGTPRELFNLREPLVTLRHELIEVLPSECGLDTYASSFTDDGRNFVEYSTSSIAFTDRCQLTFSLTVDSKEVLFFIADIKFKTLKIVGR